MFLLARRRALGSYSKKVVLKHSEFAVTQDEISTADAKALAKQLQTAKEHNQREIGLQCQVLTEEWWYSRRDISKILNISRQAIEPCAESCQYWQ